MLHVLAAPIELLLLSITAVAALFDVRTRRIPNWLSLAGCASGLAANTTLSGWNGLRNSALGLAIGFALYFPLWLLGARGAGDVKLLAAAGSLIGPGNTFALFVFASLLGGVMALGLVVVRGAVMRTAVNIAGILSSFVRFRRPDLTLQTKGSLRLPHAPVLLLSSIVLVLILVT